MYPFERFTEDAKKVLTLAQREAERSHHSYIGTEHLLLGILGLAAGAGYEALRELGIQTDQVRETIAAILGRNERIIIQQIIPTSRVKRVIEISFEESQRMGLNYVSSGHLLMAIALEGEGIAAHVLADLGADATKVIATVERIMGIPASGRAGEPRPVGDVNRLLQHRRIVNVTRSASVDELKRIIDRLAAPPDSVVQLRAQLYELQGRLGDLRRQLEQAEDDWLREITE